MKKYTTKDIPINLIDLDDFTFCFRQVFNEKDLENLKQSIENQGLLNPIKVRKKDNGFQLLAGRRRVQVVLELGYDRIQAHVYVGLDDEEALSINIADNLIHVDLNEVEIAYLVRDLRVKKELSVEKISEITQFNPQRIYNLIMLTELDPEIQQNVSEGIISLSHVVELSKFPLSKRLETLWRAVDEGWPVRRLNEERRKYAHPFLDRWTEEDIKKKRGKWHAVRFVREPEVDEIFTRVWKLIQFENMPTPFKCEFTVSIPAREAVPKYVCPNDIEWVILNPNQKGLPLEKRDAWFLFCPFCAETVFPGIQFHDIDWEPPLLRIQENLQEQPIITIKKDNSTLRGYNYMLHEY